MSEPPPQRRTRTATGAFPTSSSSGTQSAARPRFTRCSAATRRSSCPIAQGAPVLRRRSRREARGGGGASLGFSGQAPHETLEQYLALFEPAEPGQRIGEASTFYLWSPRAPRRIAEAQPEARIIAILREPASFLRSLHLQLVQNNAETETRSASALALDGPRSEGRLIPRTAHWPARPHLLGARALRRAAAPLPRSTFRPSRCSC